MSSNFSDYTKIRLGILQQSEAIQQYDKIKTQLFALNANDKFKKSQKFKYRFLNILPYMSKVIKQSKIKLKYVKPALLNVYNKDRQSSSRKSFIHLRSKLHTAAIQSSISSQRKYNTNAVNNTQSTIPATQFNTNNLDKTYIRLRIPSKSKSSIVTYKGTPNSSIEHVGKIDNFINKCSDIQNKTLDDNRNIRTASAATRKRINEISNGNIGHISNKFEVPIRKNRIFRTKTFIYGKKMEGRFVKGKYDDIIENSNRITRADYKLAKEYTRILNNKIVGLL